MGEEPRFIVIPAAGLGTRMQPVDPDIPKELLPLGNKPPIQYAVEEGLSAGIKNIIIIINKQKEIICRYFEDKQFSQKMYPAATEDLDEIRRECSFTFLYQEEPKGESDAIWYARDIVYGQSMAIMYPDNIYFPAPGALKKLKSVFDEYTEDVSALMEVHEKYAAGFSNSGRVDLNPIRDDVYRIERFHAKGQGQFVPRFSGELRTCGIAISGTHLFDYIDRARAAVTTGEFIDVPVRQLMLKEKVLLGVRLPGTVFDVGNPEGYALCQVYLREHM
jgi:UTP--glucose-1-phosphate uridylyltransferase